MPLIAALLVLIALPPPARAGWTLVQQRDLSTGTGVKQTVKETVYLEGARIRVDSSAGHTVIFNDGTSWVCAGTAGCQEFRGPHLLAILKGLAKMGDFRFQTFSVAPEGAEKTLSGQRCRPYRIESTAVMTMKSIMKMFQSSNAVGCFAPLIDTEKIRASLRGAIDEIARCCATRPAADGLVRHGSLGWPLEQREVQQSKADFKLPKGMEALATDAGKAQTQTTVLTTLSIKPANHPAGLFRPPGRTLASCTCEAGYEFIPPGDCRKNCDADWEPIPGKIQSCHKTCPAGQDYVTPHCYKACAAPAVATGDHCEAKGSRSKRPPTITPPTRTRPQGRCSPR